MSFHENLARDEDLTAGSERSFGLVMAAFFGLIGVLPALRGDAPRWMPVVIAGVFGLLALAAPRLLAPAKPRLDGARAPAQPDRQPACHGGAVRHRRRPDRRDLAAQRQGPAAAQAGPIGLRAIGSCASPRARRRARSNNNSDEGSCRS